MKLIHFIFAVYIAGLSVYPCYDDCKDDSCLSGIEVNGQSHEDALETCSPFCLSTCCAVHILSQGSIEHVTIIRKTVAKGATHQLEFMPSVIISIWQPPKLA